MRFSCAIAIVTHLTLLPFSLQRDQPSGMYVPRCGSLTAGFNFPCTRNSHPAG